MPGQQYHRGDQVIYRATKCSAHPGPRAQLVDPASNGDLYTYVVDKFWVVSEVAPDGSLDLITRTGKHRRVPADDVCLRHARWWERWWFRDRFPHLDPNTPD